MEIGNLKAWHIDVAVHPKRVCGGAVRMRGEASAQGCIKPIAGVPPSHETPAQQSEHR